MNSGINPIKTADVERDRVVALPDEEVHNTRHAALSIDELGNEGDKA